MSAELQDEIPAEVVVAIGAFLLGQRNETGARWGAVRAAPNSQTLSDPSAPAAWVSAIEDE